MKRILDPISRRRMMMGGKHDPIVVYADHDKIAEYIVNQQYDLGLCASNEYLTQSEAKLVQIISSEGKVTNLLPKDKDFSYFQFFVNAEIASTYSYAISGAFIIVPPVAINNYQCGVRRFKSSKIVLLSHTPTPLFYYYPAGQYNTTSNRFIENINSSIYVPDDSFNDWQPYIDAAVNSPSWAQSSGITLHRISELTDEERAKIKIPY